MCKIEPLSEEKKKQCYIRHLCRLKDNWWKYTADAMWWET